MDEGDRKREGERERGSSEKHWFSHITPPLSGADLQGFLTVWRLIKDLISGRQ